MKGYSTFLRAPELELHHQMQFSVIPMTLVDEGDRVLYPLQKYSQCILQSQLTE